MRRVNLKLGQCNKNVETRLRTTQRRAVVRLKEEGRNFFSIPTRPKRFWGLAVYGNWVALSARVKWRECEADHSLPSSAEFENEYRYTPPPISVFMARVGTVLPHSKLQGGTRQRVQYM